MPVYSIALAELNNALSEARNRVPGASERLKQWCAQLEAGGILYFPQTPVPIPAEDLAFLLGRQQSGSKLHKNIAYKPNRNKLSGANRKTAGAAELEQMRAAMRRYSAGVDGFLSQFLAPYGRRWKLDYASFRPIEEEGRDLPLRRRNDLLHTDAFPTRPTRGRRILRFFHNIHPTRTRDWVVGAPFGNVVGRFAPGKLAVPTPDGVVMSAGKKVARAIGLGGVLPQVKRTPYDEFMMQLHNAMKEDSEFQLGCAREQVQFAPGSSWMVYTETVPHAVLAGQYALEQTLLVDAAAMVKPESAPVRILEQMAGARLV
ncbi:MAG TPA: Kdo hydroxylase family protein [Terracidiphilus sp.]|nr:Kdo hydroxylase family protein [Terracidiphilus sp.]